MHVEAAPARLIDEAEGVAHLAPVTLPARLVMRDLDGHAAFLADANGLPHRIEQSRRLVAHVGGVEPAARAHLAREVDDLLGARVAPGLVDETGREPHRPRLHPLAHPGAHLVHLAGRGRALGESHGSRTQRAVPHEHGDVQAGPGFLHPLEILAEARPRRRGGAGMNPREAPDRGVVGHHARAAVADHVGGHALHHLEGHGGIEEDGEVIVAVHVDEAGAHRHAPRVDLRAPPLRHRPHDGDLLAGHRHVGPHAGRAGAVEHRAPANHQIESRHGVTPSRDARSPASYRATRAGVAAAIAAMRAKAVSSRGMSGPAGWNAISVVPRAASWSIRARSAAASPVKV